jgi:AraC family L-rhamnose operon transcriptional activator RhaR/AraC family L-rhamnose operon regulatory protein RhaS
MDIQFHCDEKSNFRRPNQNVSAFLYTNYSIELHSHDFYEVNIIINGTGIHQIEKNFISVKKGDVFIISPMSKHAYHNTENLDVYHILFKKSFIKASFSKASKTPGFLQFMEIEPFLREHNTNLNFLHLSPTQLIELESDLKILEEVSVFNQECWSSLRKHTAWKILYYFSYLFHEQLSNSTSLLLHKHSKLIVDTLTYIHEHFAEKLTIDFLAKRVFLSRSTFLRSFQAICNCSPIIYINDYRIKKAIDLLETTTLSKSDIAFSCGFSDASHMQKHLKKRLYADSKFN